MTIAEKIARAKTDYDEVYEAGKKSEYDTLWDNLQKNGERTHYSGAFAYTGWNDKNYNPKYPISPNHQEGIGSLFTWNREITDTKVPITAYGKCQAAFNQCAKLKRIPKLIFNGCTNVSNMFSNCSALEELYCEGTLDISGLNLQWSTKLSHDSLISVINVLKDNSGTDTWLSIVFGADNLDKLTEAELEIMTNKQWNYS